MNTNQMTNSEFHEYCKEDAQAKATYLKEKESLEALNTLAINLFNKSQNTAAAKNRAYAKKVWDEIL